MHRNEYRRMAHEEVEEIFREILPQAGMKVREEQIILCHQMLSSLCGNKIALCDAAVGVGKTYAYLVACILFRKYSQLLSGYFSMCGQSQPIVISTSSIALQEAIQREYIPFLSQVLLKKGIISAPIQAVIRKGKEHFVCDNRLELRLDAVRRKAKNPLQREALYALREQYDMDSVQHLSGFDRRMVCVPKYCPETCEMRMYCRYQKYLKEATDEKVFIQICNHNYLLADTLHRANDFRPLLRNYQALIIDEAHKFPEAARQMYGKSFGPEDFMEICSLLEGEHYTHIAAKLREAFSQLFESLPRPQGVLEEQARFRFVLQQGVQTGIKKLHPLAAAGGRSVDREFIQMDKEPAERKQGSLVTVFKCGPEQYIVFRVYIKGTASVLHCSSKNREFDKGRYLGTWLSSHPYIRHLKSRGEFSKVRATERTRRCRKST